MSLSTRFLSWEMLQKYHGKMQGWTKSHSVIPGYYYNGKFYKEETHTTELTAETNNFFTDLSDSARLYRYDGTQFVAINSGGITEARVRQIFEEMFATATREGSANDIRTYETYKSFPLIELYKASEGVAIEGTTYYTRSGSAYPYTYTVADPQPSVGESVVGYYELSGHMYTIKWDEDTYTGEIPSDNVEYVDRATQVEYIWKQLNDSDYSGEYKMVNQTADKSEIEDIFD